MADLKALQKKIATLLYEQLAQYFDQVQIVSYKPSVDGKVAGKFIGDRRNYSFVLANNQVQYLPSSTKMDGALAVRPKGVVRAKNNVVQCSGSNHPCKGEKGTRCVPDSQSCKQRETSPEGLARIKDISETSKQITALVAPNAKPQNSALAKPSPNKDEPPLDKDISLYDFLKYYSPWRPSGSKGFENARLRNVKRSAKKEQPRSKPEAKQSNKESKASQSKPSEPEANSEQKEPKAQIEPKKETTPYDFLGINPKDFPNEASLYKAAKVAYRNLAAKYHPDKGGDPKMMTELNNVMDKLKRMRRDSSRTKQ